MLFTEYFDNRDWLTEISERAPWVPYTLTMMFNTKHIWASAPISCYHFAPIVEKLVKEEFKTPVDFAVQWRRAMTAVRVESREISPLTAVLDEEQEVVLRKTMMMHYDNLVTSLHKDAVQQYNRNVILALPPNTFGLENKEVYEAMRMPNKDYGRVNSYREYSEKYDRDFKHIFEDLPALKKKHFP